MDADNITLELLSAQHSMEHFDSGDVESNVLAVNLLARVRSRDADDFVAVVAADEQTHEVAGIAATTDLVLVADNPGGEEISGKCLFYYLLAVDRDAADLGILRMLLEEFDRIRARRLARGNYVGELAAPLRGRAAEENSLMRYVERAGFRRLGPGDSLWFRPRNDD